MKHAVLRQTAVVAVPLLLATCLLLTWLSSRGGMGWPLRRCRRCNATRVAFFTAGAIAQHLLMPSGTLVCSASTKETCLRAPALGSDCTVVASAMTSHPWAEQ
jgi:hypothetical protein